MFMWRVSDRRIGRQIEVMNAFQLFGKVLKMIDTNVLIPCRFLPENPSRMYVVFFKVFLIQCSITSYCITM